MPRRESVADGAHKTFPKQFLKVAASLFENLSALSIPNQTIIQFPITPRVDGEDITKQLERKTQRPKLATQEPGYGTDKARK